MTPADHAIFGTCETIPEVAVVLDRIEGIEVAERLVAV